jgi:mono/diheme cytochrome c family protein
MKKFLKVLGWSLAAIGAVAIIGYVLAAWVMSSRYARQWAAHEVSFPIPIPLTESEIATLRDEWLTAGAPASDPLAGLDLGTIALERAVARGGQLIRSRLGCAACHGPDFGGHVLIDDPVVGRWIAPNITTGKGSVTIGYTAADWDRAVRHGLRRGGLTSTMPSIDFVNLTDQELSDIVAYIRSHPPVDRNLDKVEFGPALNVMLALGKVDLLAFDVDHQASHALQPPVAAPTEEFGAHLVQACRGCHGGTLSGGKIPGDPGMPIVANLTPDATGLKNWTEEDFVRALREGRRPDGSAISDYMPWEAYASMSDTEIRAIWAYLRTLEPVEKGRR